jgi:thiol reductant ABC exporter CydC subunit
MKSARTVQRLLRLVLSPAIGQGGGYLGRLALAVLLGLVTVAAGVGLLATAAYLIAAAALRPSIAELQVTIVGVRFFGIGRGVARYLERYLSHDVTFRLLARLRVWFYAALEPLAPARLLAHRSGDLLARIVADVETLENFYLRVLAPAAVALLATGLATLFLGSFDPRLALALLFFLLLTGAGLPTLSLAASRKTGRRLVRLRGEFNALLADGVQGVAELLAFGAEERHREKARGDGRALGRLQGRLANLDGLQLALAGLLMNLAAMAVLVVAIPLVRAGRLGGVYLALLVMAAVASFEAVLPLPQALQHLESSLEAARRLFEVIDADPAVDAGLGHDTTALFGPSPTAIDLRVEGLHFAYEPAGPPTLDGVDFTLPGGGRLAVVGPSGAGKSTLIHLLLRFWDPQAGHILLGGHDLREISQEELRRLVAVVSQRTHLFNATVRENLLLARPGATEAEVIHAAQLAQIDDFVRSLPQGYDTWIGELGQHLSGGQRQRLAIARAILKDAPILLLDEPTANLDALTAQRLMAQLWTLSVGRTTLLATHRLAGLQAASEILVLRDGRIVERGDHAGLLTGEGLYRRMWDVQQQVLASVAGMAAAPSQ